MRFDFAKTCASAMALLMAGTLVSTSVRAQEVDYPGMPYRNALQGKRIGFVPISMGFDVSQGWLVGMKREAADLGYEIIVRDPNWSIEQGIQAINSLISEKPDLLIIQNNDNRSYNRPVRRALEAGIPVIQVQQFSETQSDAYVGADQLRVGIKTAEALIAACGEGSGTSGKVALVQGASTAPHSMLLLQGIEMTLKDHPEITVVASQASDWDASKAYAITSTVLKQHPDLCGVGGFWDVADVGTAAAIREAGLQGKVALVTSGGGKKDASCDKIASGEFTSYVSFNVAGQSRDLNDAIKFLLQAKLPAGSIHFSLMSPTTTITKDSLAPNSCWTMEDLERSGY